jgi:hypothetical protein
MANPSMDRDVLAWMRQQLQEAHPDLLREMLATMAQELMGAEAQQLCGGRVRRALERADQLPQRPPARGCRRRPPCAGAGVATDTGNGVTLLVAHRTR